MGQGEMVYQGEAENVVSYFSKLGYVCPKYTNPSDFLFMNVANDAANALSTTRHATTSDDPTSTTTARPDALPKLIEAWKQSEELKHLLARMEAQSQITDNVVKSPFKSPFFYQFMILAIRSWKNATRSKFLFIARLFQILFIGFIVSVLFWDVNSKSLASQLQVIHSRYVMCALPHHSLY
jgi:hypothetical protein